MRRTSGLQRACLRGWPRPSATLPWIELLPKAGPGRSSIQPCGEGSSKRAWRSPYMSRRTCSSAERLPQRLEAARHTRFGVLLPLELQRNVTTVAGLAEDAGDAVVIEIQRVPDAAAVVGLGLYQAGARGQGLLLLVDVLQ